MKSNQLLILSIEEKTFALYLPMVERVVQSVEITSLINAPEIILGIINYHGDIIPVINTRKLFSLPEREIDILDKLVIANTAKMVVAVVAGEVYGITEFSEDELIKPAQIGYDSGYFEGIIKRNENIIIIFDLDSILEFKEENKFEEIVNNNQ